MTLAENLGPASLIEKLTQFKVASMVFQNLMNDSYNKKAEHEEAMKTDEVRGYFGIAALAVSIIYNKETRGREDYDEEMASQRLGFVLGSVHSSVRNFLIDGRTDLTQDNYEGLSRVCGFANNLHERGFR